MNIEKQFSIYDIIEIIQAFQTDIKMKANIAKTDIILSQDLFERLGAKAFTESGLPYQKRVMEVYGNLALTTITKEQTPEFTDEVKGFWEHG